MESREYFDTSDAFHITAAVEQLGYATREEARLRLTCAALAGLRACEVNPDDILDAEGAAALAVKDADACLALLYPEVPK